jgi:hypothetical protein
MFVFYYEDTVQSKKTAESATSSAKTPTPLELSRLKLDQDRVQQQVIQEQRQAAALVMQGRVNI